MSLVVREQIFFELAMAIGAVRGSKRPAASILTTYLRKLGCMAGAILRRTGEDDFETICKIPKKGGRKPDMDQAMGLAGRLGDNHLVSVHDQGLHYYAMALEGFGAMILVKSGDPFEDPVLKSLEPLNRKLSDQCQSFMRNEQIKEANIRLRDEIEARKAVEDKLRLHQEDLERQVERRTRQLRESESELRRYVTDLQDAYLQQEINSGQLADALSDLELANIKLEEYNQELTKAMALREDMERMARHDLKGPLQGIIGAVDLLAEELDLDEDQGQLLKIIERSGFDILDMVNLSLDMYKMEQGRYCLEAVPVDLMPEVSRILSEAKGVIAVKDLVTVVTVNGRAAGQGDSFMVRGERLLCYSLLSNLIKNAMEASPDGQAVTVALDTDGDRARITIHNQGEVPPGLREKFFEKYASGKKSGTGLGTYSAKLITQAQNGRIEMDTGRDSGTTVTLRLPLP